MKHKKSVYFLTRFFVNARLTHFNCRLELHQSPVDLLQLGIEQFSHPTSNKQSKRHLIHLNKVPTILYYSLLVNRFSACNAVNL